VNKEIKNFSLKNHIKKNFFKTKLYKKDKIKLDRVIKKIYKDIDIKKNTYHVLSKKFVYNFSKSSLKNFLKYKSVVVIGMGGSSLGAKAIYSFLKKKSKRKFIFFDNLDELKIIETKKKINLNNSLFIIISKSGNTIETLINTNLLKDKISSKNAIIITEQKNNLLSNYAKTKKILQINHNDYIGGRFSVLSEVGIVPAFFMGLKINSFRENILSFSNLKRNSILTESVVKLAHIYSLKKIRSIILLNYAPQLNDFLFWCQQLTAESLGKKNIGILPVVSPAPRDHHSLLQLYLDGPKDKLFYIFSIDVNKSMKTNDKIFSKPFRFVENKKISKIIDSQKKALIEVLKKKKIPFREFRINKTNEKVLGELFSYFILETTLVASVLDINPFNQPAVEEIKNLTKRYLS
tara:strand:+ start:1380 stop:2600 length:1221 start_codon:yes stop_codon:yes gene_type:complete